MYEILNRLIKIEGGHASLVMGKDGLVVAADLGTDADEDSIAAVGSQIMNALVGALDRMRMGGFKRFVVTGREGKIIMADAGSVFVVILLGLDTTMGLAGVELKEAVQEVRRKVPQ